MNHKLIVSLDKLTSEEVFPIIQDISGALPQYKTQILYKFNDLIGLIGFSGISKLLENLDVRVMLDGKWNDIPNTIRNYITQLERSGLASKVDLITIHANGGKAMLEEAVKTRDELGLDFEIFAISALTTLEDSDTQVIYDETPAHSVLKLTKLALDAGVDGMVCSGQETAMLREVFSDYNFKILNPGIRFAGGDTHDQKRVVTPQIAVEHGVDYVVMGRPILQAADMSHAVQRFFDETKDVAYIPENKYAFEKMLYTGDWKEILSYIGAFYFRPENGKYCRLTSKLISNGYINIGSIERYPLVIERATANIASLMREKNIEADIVMGAQMGSVRISLYLAEKMGISLSLYTEKTNNDNNEMDLKRHNMDLTGKKIIIGEDVVNRGSTLLKMIEVVEEKGGEVVAISCIGNRSDKKEVRGIPLISCYIPEKFEIYYDDKTPESEIKDYPHLPEGAIVSEKPKNEWGELVKSMRR